ncbi:COX15/CtaA family protein [Vibrio hepatarius]|uniref:COX15/CtaA family protein n=1 Tax=Vibrio hepatarius TaxID=171383 RepID=UPI001C0834E7|nr:COX15/CtaA family protein [Vibrio hepatarius]MBU2899225.1 COX15/CtaA family protein [Vibrio hepatarius]
MGLTNLVRLTLVMTVTVILLGAYTRLADAGLGCPDWPGCYGHLTVPDEQHEIALAMTLYPELVIEANKAWLEMIHRYFAGTLGILVFAISVKSLSDSRIPKSMPIALSAVVIFQALLGMWTVTMKLMPVVVMGHLLGGFTLFCLLMVLYWQLRERDVPKENLLSYPRGIKWLASVTLCMVIIQVALGGWTSSNYAALMCKDLPICDGNWLAYLDFERAFTLIQPEQPSYEFGTLDYGARMTIHVTHRLGAVLLTLVSLCLILALLYTKKPNFKWSAIRVSVLLAIQIGLGISNVVFSLPLVVAVAHNLVAAFLLVSILHVNYQLWHKKAFDDVNTPQFISKESSQ